MINSPSSHSQRSAAKSRNPAKEPNIMPRGPSTPLCCAQDDRGSLALLFFSCVTADQLALRDHMTFHRGIQLAPLCTRPQIQFAIESENLERIPMCAWRRTRTLVARFAEIICAVHAFGRTAFRNGIGMRRNVPNEPMSK